MKKLFVLLFVAAAFAACGDASDLASAVEGAADKVEGAADAAADAATDAADAAMDEAPAAE